MRRILSAAMAICLTIGLVSCTKTKGAIKTGSVIIVAGGSEYIPLQNFIFSQMKDGTAADSARKSPREVEGELPMVPYHDDLQIIIDGDISGEPTYTLYGSDYEEVYYRQAEFTHPDKPGDYFVSVEVTWGGGEAFEGYQYLFAVSWPLNKEPDHSGEDGRPGPSNTQEAPEGYSRETVAFPANEIRKTEYNTHIYGIEPFDLSLLLPNGWTIESPGEDAVADDPFHGGLWSPVWIYKNGEPIGMIEYNTFEKYPEAGGNYRAVYNQIMLGSVASWDRDYTPVTETPTACTATCRVAFKTPEQGQAMAAAEEGYNKGILSYDEDLLVYIAIEMADEYVTEEQWLAIAKSIALSGKK